MKQTFKEEPDIIRFFFYFIKYVRVFLDLLMVFLMLLMYNIGWIIIAKNNCKEAIEYEA